MTKINEVQKCNFNDKKCPYFCEHNEGCSLKLISKGLLDRVMEVHGEYDCHVYKQELKEIKKSDDMALAYRQETTPGIRTLEVIETEINFYKGQAATGIIEIGKRLIEAKEKLQHGEWGKWLEKKVDFSQEIARRFMKIAEEFSNSSAGRNLGARKLFLLLDVPAEEREEFVEKKHIVDDEEKAVDEMTTRELERVIREKKELEDKLRQSSDRELYLQQRMEEKDKSLKDFISKQRPEVKIIEKEVIPSDYKKLKHDIQDKTLEIESLTKEKELLEKKVKLNESEAQKYNNMKKQIDYLYQQKNDLARQIESATELSGLAVKIDQFLKTELAPIKYSRILERMDSEVARGNLLDIIDKIDQWSFEIKQMIPKEYRRLEVYHE